MQGKIGGLEFDRRVTTGHILTTITMVFAAIVWSISIQGRVDIADERIATNARDIERLRVETRQQYSEILRQLEYMSAKADKHLEQHAQP